MISGDNIEGIDVSKEITSKPGTLDQDAETTLRQRSVQSERKEDDSVEHTSRNSRNTVKISPIKKPHTVQNDKSSLNESLNSSRSMSDAKMMLKHFEFLRIVLCVMVAYLCRRVLSSGYGIFYFEVRTAFLKVEILFYPGNLLFLIYF